MEPLRNLALGDVSRARRRRVDRALSAPAGEPAARSGRAPSPECVNRAFAAGKYSDTPGYPGRGPVYDLDVHRTADDRAVEALLASVKKPCAAQQLATRLGWTLDRTVGALQRLEAGLVNTGQILTRLGHHRYTLGPRPGLVNDREIARCLRHNREPLDLTAATVLHRALTCSREDRARDARTSPAEHAAADRLIAAGLLDDRDGVLRPTPRAEATFRASADRRHLR
jgi:hypothetical protein